MDVVETIMDAGFDASIRENMDHEDYQRVVNKALAGDAGAKTVYLEKFFETIRNVDEDLHKGLIRKVILHGPEKGVEEFLEDMSDIVLDFENEVFDMLKDHINEGFPTLEETVEVELEDLFLGGKPEAQDLVFRFWAPGEGTRPLVEFTCMNPEERDDYVLTRMDEVIAASCIPELREIVEDTLHDLKTHGGE